MARPQWDDWESLRIIQVIQDALITVGAAGVAQAAQGLPAATPQPASAAAGPQQLLAQVWQLEDMRTWTFPMPSCTTQVNCWLPWRVVCILFLSL